MLNPEKFLKYVKLINFYPPFLGSGIRVKEVNAARTRYVVELKLRFYNRNIYGTQFGGSLFSMCDPFYVFIAYAYFGNDYILWDKAACIKYIRPGRSHVEAIFEIEADKLKVMKAKVDKLGKATFTFDTEIYDQAGKTIASVEKEIYIKKKRING